MDSAKAFKQVLNNPEGRVLVDAIEDTHASLRGHKGEPVLLRSREKQIEELETKTGYRYGFPLNEANLTTTFGIRELV